MKILSIYDPAMCCSSGVCGTSVDTKLIELEGFLKSLDKTKFQVKRYNLSSNPQEYVSNQAVSKLLHQDGVAILPLFFLDDALIFSKEYPSTPQLSSKIGLSAFVPRMS